MAGCAAIVPVLVELPQRDQIIWKTKNGAVACSLKSLMRRGWMGMLNSGSCLSLLQEGYARRRPAAR